MPSIRPLLPAALLLIAAAPVHAADRWQEAGSGAVAILPDPASANGIIGGSLYCAEQKWAFHFRTPQAALTAGDTVPAKITISGELLQLEARTEAGGARVAVPTAALPSLKNGTSLAVEVGDTATGVAALFNLRGSKLVIEAVAPKCSQVDMSEYDLVALSETDPAVEHARLLIADEMKLFTAATNRQPVVAAKIADVPPQNRLMFASICGSTTYYGTSGCNLTGFAQIGPLGEWRQVYNTEGMIMHTDPNAGNGGWPNLVTLPMVGGLEPTHWVWSGSQYELRDVLIAGDKPQ
ncbi:MAG: hypothetical protein KF723_18740 [Rhizobiaceae bacterium]|nr:hypothetical protein [Rhizobiaceae bacterium]